MRDVVRKAGWAVAVISGIAIALFGLLDLRRPAWLFLGIALIALSAAAFLSFQRLASAVAKETKASLKEHETAVTAALAKVNSTAADTRKAADTDKILRPLNNQTKTLTSAITGLRKQLEHQPYVVAELQRRYQDLIDSDLPMPVLGANWAATAPTILFIVDEVLGGSGRRTMLECGSGASTLWTAAALRKRGEGHVTTLEHDRDFAEVTRQKLREHGLESWATIIDAPLVDIDVPGLGTQPWYDVSGLGDLADVDLVFVDGPPRPTAPLARYPALPQLMARLRHGALIILDDTNRKAERDITKMWAADGAFNRPVTFVKDVARSTVLRVD